MTGIVLQARLDSTRLPEKALLPIGGKPLILRVMEALNQIPADIRILACTEDSLCQFTPFAKEAGFHIFAGPRDDVLERYCQVIRKYSLSRVIRATGDNPFVFADSAQAINTEALKLKSDYAGYIDMPYGAGTESIRASSLLKAANEASLLYDREHVCPYLYNNPGLFKIHRPKWVINNKVIPISKTSGAEFNAGEIRLSVDTREDYMRAVVLYDSLKDEQFRFNSDVILRKYLEIYK